MTSSIGFIVSLRYNTRYTYAQSIGIEEGEERHNSMFREMRRQPTITRTWRVFLNPRAHYNLSCGKDNRFSRCRRLHPDDVVCVVVVLVIGVALRWDPRPRKAMPRQLPPPNFPHVHVASPCSDSPAYTRLRYRYTCVGTPGYTCALR